MNTAARTEAVGNVIGWTLVGALMYVLMVVQLSLFGVNPLVWLFPF